MSAGIGLLWSIPLGDWPAALTRIGLPLHILCIPVLHSFIPSLHLLARLAVALLMPVLSMEHAGCWACHLPWIRAVVLDLHRTFYILLSSSPALFLCVQCDAQSGGYLAQESEAIHTGSFMRAEAAEKAAMVSVEPHNPESRSPHQMTMPAASVLGQVEEWMLQTIW